MDRGLDWRSCVFPAVGQASRTAWQQGVLKICVALKPINMLCLMFAPRDPQLAFWPCCRCSCWMRPECRISDHQQRVPAEALSDREPHDVCRGRNRDRGNGWRSHRDHLRIRTDRDGGALAPLGPFQLTGYHVLSPSACCCGSERSRWSTGYKSPRRTADAGLFAAGRGVTVRVYRSIEGTIRTCGPIRFRLRPSSRARPFLEKSRRSEALATRSLSQWSSQSICGPPDGGSLIAYHPRSLPRVAHDRSAVAVLAVQWLGRSSDSCLGTHRPKRSAGRHPGRSIGIDSMSCDWPTCGGRV